MIRSVFSSRCARAYWRLRLGFYACSHGTYLLLNSPNLRLVWHFFPGLAFLSESSNPSSHTQSYSAAASLFLYIASPSPPLSLYLSLASRSVGSCSSVSFFLSDCGRIGRTDGRGRDGRTAELESPLYSLLSLSLCLQKRGSGWSADDGAAVPLLCSGRSAARQQQTTLCAVQTADCRRRTRSKLNSVSPTLVSSAAAIDLKLDSRTAASIADPIVEN